MASGSGSSSDNLLKDAKVNSRTVWLSGKGFTDAGPSQKKINSWVKKVNRTKKGRKIPSKSSNTRANTNNDATAANNDSVTPAKATGKTLVG